MRFGKMSKAMKDFTKSVPDGRVKACEKQVQGVVKHTNDPIMRTRKEKTLKGALDGEGYLHVRLSKNGKAKLFKIHSLVAQSFLQYDPSAYDRKNIESLVVHHLDENKTNNDINNLMIVTQRENIRLYFDKNK